DVWAALQRADVVADRRRVASTSEVPGTRMGHDRSFRLDHVVEDLITFPFSVEWWMSRVEANGDVPTFAAARSTLVAPNEFMQIVDVHVALVEVAETITAVQIQRHTRTLSFTAEDDARSYVEDLYASLAAAAKGEPLPEF